VNAATAVTLLLAASVLAGCSGNTASFPPVEAPDWKTGFAWSWEVRHRIQGFEQLAGEKSSIDEPETATHEILEVLNTSIPTADGRVWLAVRSVVPFQGLDACASREGSCQVTTSDARPDLTLEGFRPSDLANLEVSYSFSQQCANGGTCRNELKGLQVDSSSALPFLSFPLQKGKHWTGSRAPGSEAETEGALEDYGLVWSRTARVVGLETVETPVGTLEAIRVDFTKTPTHVHELREAIAKDAKAAGGSLDRFVFDYRETTTVHYAPAYSGVVRARSTAIQLLEVTGKDEEGESFEFVQSFTETRSRTLTGVILLQKQERDLEYVARVLAREVPVFDPSGILMDQRTVEVTAALDKTIADATAGQSVNATATIKDSKATGGKSDLLLEWKVLDYLQKKVGGGTGTRFTYNFTNPGLYSIQVDAKDAASGRIFASALQNVEAIWNETRLVLMEPATVPARAAFSIPVKPGIKILEILATPEGLQPPETGTYITLRDPDRTSVKNEASSPVYFRLTDFSGHYLGDENWTVDIKQNIDTAGHVRVDVRERYMPSQGSLSPPSYLAAFARR
jgi:hypothetical protein